MGLLTDNVNDPFRASAESWMMLLKIMWESGNENVLLAILLASIISESYNADLELELGHSVELNGESLKTVRMTLESFFDLKSGSITSVKQSSGMWNTTLSIRFNSSGDFNDCSFDDLLGGFLSWLQFKKRWFCGRDQWWKTLEIVMSTDRAGQFGNVFNMGFLLSN